MDQELGAYSHAFGLIGVEMALTEHEQHLLAEIETTLTTDSPALARALRRWHRRRRWPWIIAWLACLAAVIAALTLSLHSTGGLATAMQITCYLLVATVVATLLFPRPWR